MAAVARFDLKMNMATFEHTAANRARSHFKLNYFANLRRMRTISLVKSGRDLTFLA